MRLGKVEVDRNKLKPKAELIGFLEENGETDRVLSKIQDQQYEEFGAELIWRYPISDDDHTGMYIAVVKEGFLSLPYSEVGLEGWECIDLKNAAMLTAEDMRGFIHSWRRIFDDLLNVMNDILFVMNNE